MQNIWDFIKKLLSWILTRKTTPVDTKVSDTKKSTTTNKIKPTDMTENGSGTLYALCVGINDYQYVPKLGGCVPDATNVHNYLKSSCANTDYKFDAVMLTDAQATKANVVKNFQEHLGKAKAGDIAVFYFSGHGAEEGADEVFWSASQKKTLNTMVCYDSRSPEGVPDLADKELRYLINQITYSEDKDATFPHFVLITDSCHSGGATREADGEMVARLTEKGSTREWDRFIFSEKLSKEDFANATSLKALIPQGQHVHYSSCQGTELAYEVRGSGVFTGTMLEVLSRTSGKITYRDLHNRVRSYIKGRFPQTPTIHAVEGGAVDAMTMDFLGGASEQKGLTANVVFNTKARAWNIDMGAIQGIPTDGFAEVGVSVLNHDGSPLTSATITKVGPDSCTLDFEDEDKVDIRESYSAEITGIYRNPVAIYLDASTDAAAIAAAKQEFVNVGEALTKENNIKLVDSFAGSDYTISVQKEHYVISRTSDAKHRPIVEQQPVGGANTFKNLMDYTKFIARYDFIMALSNPKTKLTAGDPSKPPAGIEVYRVPDEDDRSKDELIAADENGRVVVEDGEVISIKTVNNSRRQKLFFSLISDATFEEEEGVFGVNPSSLGESAQEMLPEEQLWLWEIESFPVSHDDYVLDFKYPETTLNFKLIASTETFDVSKFKQVPLPYPFLYDKGDAADTRGLKRRSRPDGADWCTYDVTIVIKNENGE